ncbi:hypothetical protein GCM10010985_61410 [Caballeronia grimmiae]|uniref:Uncharacterized protein n=1 Tax=Caballeronia grimmiae TaxID=1071679 RepID=A0ABQ1SC06_9BURK|nr:hypothetical protein GCM10010985_61410 [Caballeronia grimmiae]
MSAVTRNVQPVISNIGKHGSGELVSSRYAVRVGAHLADVALRGRSRMVSPALDWIGDYAAADPYVAQMRHLGSVIRK